MKIISLLVLAWIMIITPAYAQNGENETSLYEETNDSFNETEIETNFVIKDYDIDGSDKKNYLVEGGNENAINSLATEQNNAKGTVVESVNVSGLPYDLSILSDEEKETMNVLELRQFLSFKTKSGKVFHLIIDHSKSNDNVQMLTEVGEQDLLNLIEEYADVKLILNEVEDEITSEETGNKVTGEKDDNSEFLKIEDSPINSNTIIIIVISVMAGVAGWYFKIYKPKQLMDFEVEVDEADFIDEETFIEDEFENKTE